MNKKQIPACFGELNMFDNIDPECKRCKFKQNCEKYIQLKSSFMSLMKEIKEVLTH